MENSKLKMKVKDWTFERKINIERNHRKIVCHDEDGSSDRTGPIKELM